MARAEATAIESLRLSSDKVHNADLHEKADSIVSAYQASPSVTNLPDTLRDLLITIIKPLFSTKQHPSLAPSGRKAHFAPAPTFPHAEPLILDDSDKPWKLSFDSLTSPLLHSILASYTSLPPDILKPTIEQHIFLLTPALLNMIDYPSPTVKTTGFHLLHTLSTTLSTSQSPILHQSGLTQVFITAIEPNFLLLPTLTPEPDSLQILTALYPALLSLIAAEFPTTLPGSPTTFTTGNPAKAHEATRQTHLTHLLRHGLLASLSHLNAGVATSHPALSTLLLRQLAQTLTMMGIYATAHLQRLVPLLRAVVCEPFALAAPEMVCAALDALGVLVRVCDARVKGRWWGEVLRGLVGGWCAVLDEVGEGDRGADGRRKGGAEVAAEESEKEKKKNETGLRDVKARLKTVTQALGLVVAPDDWSNAKQRLCEEEPQLEGLFA